MKNYVNSCTCVDGESDVLCSFFEMFEKIKEQNGVPVENPVYIKSYEETDAFYTNEGESVTKIHGVVTMLYEKDSEERVYIGYCVKYYGEDVAITSAIKSIEEEMREKHAIPVGVITNIPLYEFNVTRYDTVGNAKKDKAFHGALVQVYKVPISEALSIPFK